MDSQDENPFADLVVDELFDIDEDSSPPSTSASAMQASQSSQLVIPPSESQAGTSSQLAMPSSEGQAGTKSSPCWGQVLAHGSTNCTAGFVAQPGHFKLKFCTACIETGFAVDPACALLLPPGGASSFANTSSQGVWTEKNGIHYRLLNQTRKCKDQPLILVRDAADALTLGFESVPSSMVEAGRLHLSIAHGTLVPTARLRLRKDHLVQARVGFGRNLLGAIAGPSREPASCSGLDSTTGPAARSEAHVGSSEYELVQHMGAAGASGTNPGVAYRDRGSSSSSPECGQESDGSFKRSSGHESDGSYKRCRSSSDLESEAIRAGSQGAAASQPSEGSQLLALATLQAEFGGKLQEAIDLAASSTDPALRDYHEALCALIPSLSQASEALRRAVDAVPPSARSFPPSPPATTSTAGRASRGRQDILMQNLVTPLPIVNDGNPGPSAGSDAVLETNPKPNDPYLCDRQALLAFFCFPLFAGQLWQRNTRTGGGCLCFAITIGGAFLGVFAWVIFVLAFSRAGHVDAAFVDVDAFIYPRLYFSISEYTSELSATYGEGMRSYHTLLSNDVSCASSHAQVCTPQSCSG